MSIFRSHLQPFANNLRIQVFANKNDELITHLCAPKQSTFLLGNLLSFFFVAGTSEKPTKQRFEIKVGTACLESPSDCAEYGFRRVLFDFTCRYGMEPLRPLRLLLVV